MKAESRKSNERKRSAIGDQRSAKSVWRWPVFGVAALLLLHFLLAAAGVWRKSITYDELAHLTRGVSYLKLGDYRLGPPHPPLAHYLAALPVMGLNPRLPSLDQRAWRRSDVWSFGQQFLFDTRLRNDPDAMLFRGRCMIALLSAGLGLLVFAWSRSLFGLAGGLLSLTLYVFDPTMLAHGSLVTTDLVSAAFFTASIAALWRVSHRLTWLNLLLTCAAVALMFLAKGSGVLMAFMGLLLIVIRIIDGQPMMFALRGPPRELKSPFIKLGCLAAVTFALVLTTDAALWAAYGFRWSPFRGGGSTPAEYDRDAKAGLRDYFTASAPPAGKSAWDWQKRGLGTSAKFCKWVHDHKLLPDAYVYGFLSMLQSARGRDSFLNGERMLHGSTVFFPYAFAVKTPLPLFAMLLLAAYAAISRRSLDSKSEIGNRPSEMTSSWWSRFYPTLPLWTLLLVYGFTSARSTLNIGHRHLLPLYPALFILCGAAGSLVMRKSERDHRRWNSRDNATAPVAVPRGLKPAARYATFAVLFLFILASFSVFPHYLAYFNWLAGGPANGYKHLVDSSLDWGQDLPTLARNIKADHADKPVYLQYFGRGSPTHEGIVSRPIYQRLPENGRGELRLHGGLYCISATTFQQLYVLDTSDMAAIEGRDFDTFKGLAIDWTPRYETAYQAMLPAMQRLADLPDDPTTRLDFLRQWRPDYADAYYRFTKLRFMRLCAHLRQREPDDMAGYSILMFNLSDDDVRRMTEGPPPGISEPRRITEPRP